MTAVRVVRHADATAFLERAEAWLLRDEAEHNLILGITGSLRAGRGAYRPPFYLATIERGDEIVGCAFRTPPYKLGLTRMPNEAILALVDDVADVYEEVPAVLGPEREAHFFAQAWSEVSGTTARVGMRNRIYRLEQVAAGLPQVAGAMRTAGEADADLVIRWIEAFYDDVRMPARRGDEVYRDRIAQGEFVLWEDRDEPVSLAGVTGRTRHGIRVGPVYTPPQFRRRGYATACVAALSQRMLDSGRRLCFLYTDLDNPTSNSIYQQIGYRPVCDVVDVVFHSTRAPR